ncbi:MAG: carboxypeptidase regulatory-like domain-containing protein [Kiritimatiellaeota bacterium]|nr:carboxypeptidase regulatory-like domain-containing protein [Kiritimatiellota bacterium]
MRKPATFMKGCLLLALFWGGAAGAHRVKLFAAGEGDRISGYAYFPGGARAKDCLITVYAPDGAKLGETRTDSKGEFSFRTDRHCDHRLVLDAGDGHRTEFTVSADELGPGLPVGGTDAPVTPPTIRPLGRRSAAAAPSPAPPGDLGKLLDRILARRLRPLEERLDRYEDRVRWHDVIGGIGYILGIAGLYVLLKSGRRSPAN